MDNFFGIVDLPPLLVVPLTVLAAAGLSAAVDLVTDLSAAVVLPALFELGSAEAAAVALGTLGAVLGITG